MGVGTLKLFHFDVGDMMFERLNTAVVILGGKRILRFSNSALEWVDMLRRFDANDLEMTAR